MDTIAEYTRQWAEQQAELENLRVVVAALILRGGGSPIELSGADIDAAAMWHLDAGIHIRTLRLEPPLSFRVELLAEDQVNVT